MNVSLVFVGCGFIPLTVENEASKSIIELLNSNSGVITAIATVLLTVATIVLVYETSLMRKFTSTPIIALQTRPSVNMAQNILLSITNCGNGVAKNIHLSTISTFPAWYNEKGKPVALKDLGIFKHRFDLGAQQKFEFILKYLPEDYDILQKNNQLKFSITAEYEDYIGKKCKPITYDFDLELYHHLKFPNESPILRILNPPPHTPPAQSGPSSEP